MGEVSRVRKKSEEIKRFMKRLRLWIIIAGVWLTFLFNIERILFHRFDANLIRSDTYIFVALVALVALLLPKLNDLSFAMLLIIVVALFLYVWQQDSSWRRNVSANYVHLNATVLLTVIQINAIILTGLLTRQITYSLSEFENVIASITFSHTGKRPTPFAEGQTEMYREVRRAARYERPLAMMALKVDKNAIQMALPQMVREVQRAMINEFTLAKVTRVLDENLLGFDRIALKDNCIIVAVLPETQAGDVAFQAQQLKRLIKEKTNIRVKIGTATFPDEAITFESLVALAVENAEQESARILTPEKKQEAVA